MPCLNGRLNLLAIPSFLSKLIFALSKESAASNVGYPPVQGLVILMTLLGNFKK